MLALLGPNGAGKTSTIEVCEGFRAADGGTVRVLGLRPARPGAARPGRGDAADRRRLPGAARRRGAAAVRLLPAATRSTPPTCWTGSASPTCSARPCAGCPAARRSGCRWRSPSSAGPSWCSSTSRPPASTRRPGSRPGTWCASLRRDGATVVLTTHLMDEAETLADDVVIVDAGRVVAAGSVTELTRGAADRAAALAGPARPGPRRAAARAAARHAPPRSRPPASTWWRAPSTRSCSPP